MLRLNLSSFLKKRRQIAFKCSTANLLTLYDTNMIADNRKVQRTFKNTRPFPDVEVLQDELACIVVKRLHDCMNVRPLFEMYHLSGKYR